MIVAVTYNNGLVFPHFGETKEFKLYEIENDKIISSKIIEAGQASHIALIPLIKETGAKALICGGMGRHAAEALMAQGIKVYNNVMGDADKAIESFIEGKLTFDEGKLHICSHHH